MTKNLRSKWQDNRVRSFELSKLTPMDLHSDERWKTRDLTSIRDNGMYYPIMLYKVTLDWWNDTFAGWRPKAQKYVDPIVNEDGMIWVIKMGSNRYQCASHLGYNCIDGIMFDNPNDCVKLAVWFRECDPLNNKNAPPYSGAYGY
jgi:hypothetical protein